MAFFVGQKVVCINSDADLCPGGNGEMDGLAEGRVYTVRRVDVDLRWLRPSLWLVEIVRPIQYGGEAYGEIGFWQGRFRPVVEPKTETDITVFLEMLNKAPKKVAEPV